MKLEKDVKLRLLQTQLHCKNWRQSENILNIAFTDINHFYVIINSLTSLSQLFVMIVSVGKKIQMFPREESTISLLSHNEIK